MSDYDPNYVPHKTFTLVGQKAIIKNGQGQILLLQRSAKSGAGGKWSLPGGAIEFNEEPYAGISREITEETQLEVKNLRPFTLKQYLSTEEENVIIIGYIGETDSTDVVLNWEHDAFQWLRKEDALALDLTADGRFFVEKVE